MNRFLPFLLLLISTSPLLAQLNYISNSPTSNTPGSYNSLIGVGAGNATLTGDRNTITGYAAGQSMTSGIRNSFYGVDAGQANTSGGQNTFMGFEAGLKNTQGYDNTFLGRGAGLSNTTGSTNTFLGRSAGSDNTTGYGNVSIGTYSGWKNTTGYANVFSGSNAGLSNTEGANNTFLGYIAGQDNTTGRNNVFIGHYAGLHNVTGNSNVMIGQFASPRSGNDKLVNAVAIGANAKVAVNNGIVLGNPDNTSIAVGIGTDSPQYPLDVRGVINLRDRGTLKFSHLSNPHLRNGATDQFLTVNETGETVLARYQVKLSSTDQWADKVFEQGYTLRPLSEVDSFVKQHKHLPGIPSAEEMVKEGLSLEGLNARLLEKIEELTLYSIQQQNRIDRMEQIVEKLVSQK